jgi:hypothetical protein
MKGVTIVDFDLTHGTEDLTWEEILAPKKTKEYFAEYEKALKEFGAEWEPVVED